MTPFLKSEPLDIVSVLVESVDGDGRCAPICVTSSFDEVEAPLAQWLRKAATRWPGGVVPLRVRVTFPRRLVFTYDFFSDEFGLMEHVMPSFSGEIRTRTVTMREALALALEAALNSTTLSVDALAAKRVARIVLAYGSPAALGN